MGPLVVCLDFYPNDLGLLYNLGEHLECAFSNHGVGFTLISPLELVQLLPLRSMSEHFETFRHTLIFSVEPFFELLMTSGVSFKLTSSK